MFSNLVGKNMEKGIWTAVVAKKIRVHLPALSEKKEPDFSQPAKKKLKLLEEWMLNNFYTQILPILDFLKVFYGVIVLRFLILPP